MACAIRDQYVASYNRALVMAALKRIGGRFFESTDAYGNVTIDYIYNYGVTHSLKYNVTVWMNSYGEVSVYHGPFMKRDNGVWEMGALSSIPTDYRDEAARKFAICERRIKAALVLEVGEPADLDEDEEDV